MQGNIQQISDLHRVQAEDIPIRIIANDGVIPKFYREHVKLSYFIGESCIESELRKLKCFYEGVRILMDLCV